jgi:hypothetical protein
LCRPPGPLPQAAFSPRGRALSFSLLPRGRARTPSPLSLRLGAKAAMRPPFPIPSLRAGLATLKRLPLPLAHTWPGARFLALDSAAPSRKLTRSRRRPTLSGELRPVRRGLHICGRLTPPFVPSSFELQEHAMTLCDHRAVFPTAVASRLLRLLHVAPPLRHSPAAISTAGGCATPWRCSRCAPHRVYAVGEPSPPTPPCGPQPQ